MTPNLSQEWLSLLLFHITSFILQWSIFKMFFHRKRRNMDHSDQMKLYTGLQRRFSYSNLKNLTIYSLALVIPYYGKYLEEIGKRGMSLISAAWVHLQLPAFIENNFLNFHDVFKILDTMQFPLTSKYFNVVSTLSFGWYNVATWDKSTLKQRCVFQRWNLQRQTISNQCCVFQPWSEQH